MLVQDGVVEEEGWIMEPPLMKGVLVGGGNPIKVCRKKVCFGNMRVPEHTLTSFNFKTVCNLPNTSIFWYVQCECYSRSTQY